MSSPLINNKKSEAGPQPLPSPSPDLVPPQPMQHNPLPKYATLPGEDSANTLTEGARKQARKINTAVQHKSKYTKEEKKQQRKDRMEIAKSRRRDIKHGLLPGPMKEEEQEKGILVLHSRERDWVEAKIKDGVTRAEERTLRVETPKSQQRAKWDAMTPEEKTVEYKKLTEKHGEPYIKRGWKTAIEGQGSRKLDERRVGGDHESPVKRRKQNVETGPVVPDAPKPKYYKMPGSEDIHKVYTLKDSNGVEKSYFEMSHEEREARKEEWAPMLVMHFTFQLDSVADVDTVWPGHNGISSIGDIRCTGRAMRHWDMADRDGADL
ncbi:MAG: hypothetical protein MMC33_009809 [Icmadophila ericetorum]|nr:hypothetical protein [Icmadophila ericetorum]